MLNLKLNLDLVYTVIVIHVYIL